MGIQLDWQIADDEGHQVVEEDPHIIRDRERRRRRRRRLMVFVLIVLVAAGLAGGIRLRQANQARRALLQESISAELLALRIADRESFLDAQLPVAEWRQMQNRAFSRYQVLVPRIQVTDQILDMKFRPNEAEVHIAITVDDQPAELIWDYVYQDTWRHAASIDDPWDIRTHRVDYLDFSYYALDQAIVDSLDAELSVWLSAFCQADLCDHLNRITIRPRPGSHAYPEWRDESQNVLIVPLLVEGQGQPAPDILPETREIIDITLAERWARDLLTDGRANREPWVLDETLAWLMRARDDSIEPTAVIDPLYAAYGPDMLAASFDAMHEGFPARTAFRMAARGQAPADLSDEELARHLTLLLQVEAALPSDFPISWTDILFLDQDDIRDTSTTVDDYLAPYNINLVDPRSVQVLSVQRQGRIVWAEVAYSLTPEPDLLEPLPVTYQPFTYDDGGWVHLTRLRRENRLLLRGDTVDLLYGDADAQYVDDLLPYAELVYAQVSADLGLDDPPPVSFELTPYIPYAQSASYAVIYPRAASVYINCCKPGVDPVTHLQQETAYAFVREVLAYQLGDRATSTALGHALLFAELRRLGLDVDFPEPPPGFEGEDLLRTYAPPETLLDRRDGGFVRSSPDYMREYARLISAELLLSILQERYGADVIADLTTNYVAASSVDDLLTSALGITIEDVVADWNQAMLDYARSH